MARNYLLLRQILSPSPNYFCFCARNLFLFLCLPLHILNIANISINVNNSVLKHVVLFTTYIKITEANHTHFDIVIFTTGLWENSETTIATFYIYSRHPPIPLPLYKSFISINRLNSVLIQIYIPVTYLHISDVPEMIVIICIKSRSKDPVFAYNFMQNFAWFFDIFSAHYAIPPL